MTAKTYLVKEERPAPGPNIANEVQIAVGGDRAGDLNLKPMLVYYSDNFGNSNRNTKCIPPVIIRNNSKSCVLGRIFQMWSFLHFYQ
jgi:hypothetical protein